MRIFALCLACSMLCLAGCDFQRQADNTFGDQQFKTTIALIELHKVRYGTYPQTLEDLKFVGDWDAIALQSVDYRKVEDGYELDVVRGWVGEPRLAYPAEFWHGLGLTRSNVKTMPASKQ